MSRQTKNEADRMVAEVMKHTSGSACARAREAMCLRVDSEIDEMTEILLANHTAHCCACHNIDVMLPRIISELKTMQDLQPDAAFAVDVLNSTSRNMLFQRRSPWKRTVDVIDRLLRRPRIAWEFAYSMTIILILVLKLSGTPIHAIQPAIMPIFDGGVVVRVYSSTGEVVQTIGRRIRDESAEQSQGVRQTVEDMFNEFKRNTMHSVEKVQNTGRVFKVSLTEKRIEPAMMEVVDLWNSISLYFRANPEKNDGGQNGTSDEPGV